MKKAFPLFQSHLDLAHFYWSQLITIGDTVIDATCGNGFDTLKLCHLALSQNSGKLYAFDIQNEAIISSKKYLSSNLEENMLKRIDFFLQSHATFPESIPLNSVKLIVYNLGYLPGGNKSVTTELESTLESLLQAIKLIQPSGAISITCYPGHTKGAKEQESVRAFAASLSPKEWSCCHHFWLNRQLSPSLLFIQRSM